MTTFTDLRGASPRPIHLGSVLLSTQKDLCSTGASRETSALRVKISPLRFITLQKEKHLLCDLLFKSIEVSSTSRVNIFLGSNVEPAVNRQPRRAYYLNYHFLFKIHPREASQIQLCKFRSFLSSFK